jgi:hypothetical protein
MSILGNTQKGLSARELRQVYLQAILPILTYASPVWFNRIRQKGLVEKIQKVQNIALRKITGAFRTTNIQAMESIISIPPVIATLTKLNYQYSTRIRSLGMNHPVIARLPLWAKGYGEIIPPLPPSDNTNLGRLGAIGDPNAPSDQLPTMYFPWESHLSSMENIHVELGPKKKSKEFSKEIMRVIEERSDLGHIIAFTDGSLLPPNTTYTHKISSKHKRTKYTVVAPMRIHPNNRDNYHPDTLFPVEEVDQSKIRTGSAFTVGHMNNMVAEQKAALGPKASIFDAEIYAILLFLEWLNTALDSDTFRSDHPTKFVSIFSDCKGAIQTTSGKTP